MNSNQFPNTDIVRTSLHRTIQSPACFIIKLATLKQLSKKGGELDDKYTFMDCFWSTSWIPRRSY